MPGAPGIFCRRDKRLKKIFLNYLANMAFPPTFALPKENWDLQNVSANQNQITVLRSQPGR